MQISISHKRYNQWKGGLGYRINKPQEVYNNYNFFIQRDIGDHFTLEYRYAFNTVPTYIGLQYEDFDFVPILMYCIFIFLPYMQR